MLALEDLQREMRAGLLGEGGPELWRAIAGDGLRPEARLAVYRNNLFTSLTDALALVFPVVRKLVDPRFFAFACHDYIAAHPPRGPCLFEYGRTFPDFLGGFAPCRGLPYLADVARFEWLQNEVLHAADEEPLDPSPLASLAERSEDLRFRVRPTYKLLRSPFPVDAIWRANQADADPQAGVDLGSGGASIEVRRLGDDVVFRTLAPADFAFRAAVAGGSSLADAASAALAADPPFDLVVALRQLFAEGVPTAFSLVAPKKKMRP